MTEVANTNGAAGAGQAVANANGDGGAAAQPQQSSWLGSIWRFVAMYMLIQFIFGRRGSAPTVDKSGALVQPHRNLWHDGTHFDAYLYVSEHDSFDKQDLDEQKPLWTLDDIVYDWSAMEARELNVTLTCTPTLQRNGTMYAHMFVVRRTDDGQRGKIDLNDRHGNVLRGTHRLVEYMEKKRERVGRKLLDASASDADANNEDADRADDGSIAKREALGGELVEGGDDNEAAPIISYWKPALTMSLIVDQTQFPHGGVPPQIVELMRMHRRRQCVHDPSESDGCKRVDDPSAPGKRMRQYEVIADYEPVLWFNEFWLLREQLTPINESVAELPLLLRFEPLGLYKWTMMVQMNQSFHMQEQWGAAQAGDSDELKRVLTDTNPILLGVTFVVSMLHMLFDFLAFKNDIQFWKNRKSVTGVSVRTMFVNFFCQLVILLYLMDNETSWMVVLSSGIGIVIDAWKITKATLVRVHWYGDVLPYLSFTDRNSYAESATKRWDRYAMTYLGFVCFPLVAGYALYSLIYESHRGWYSWILSSLCGAVYTFGMVLMTPQLFINYKLKSVAHLPIRVFIYRALNTFVDDLFAFVVRMPTMHRLACFRDDIVFFIILYQRWIYKVDPKRANEYGRSEEDYKEIEALKNDSKTKAE